MLYRNRPGNHVKSLAPNQLSATMNMPTNLSSRQVANKKTSPFSPPPSPTDPNTGFVSLHGLSGWPWQIEEVRDPNSTANRPQKASWGFLGRLGDVLGRLGADFGTPPERNGGVQEVPGWVLGPRGGPKGPAGGGAGAQPEASWKPFWKEI